jgi:type 1 glutamine amidotransferase
LQPAAPPGLLDSPACPACSPAIHPQGDRSMFRRPFPLVLAVLAGALGALSAVNAPRAEEKKAAAKIKVLLIDGQNNHDWRSTSPHLKKVLEDSGKFTVAVSSNLKKGEKPGRIKDTVPFPPDLSKYDVVLSNYNGEAWPKEFQKSFNEKIKSGKLGLVIVHAANNSFGDWKEYNEMIGMGWRGRGAGDRLKLDDKGKEVRVAKGKDDDSGHRYTGKFSIVVRDAKHAITKGMPREWMHANDELYDNMRGPILNVHVLATAYSKGTKAHEPMIWTISYGKGRVFHTPMGHDLTGMRCVGFITTLLRGTEWAATGKVTIPIPRNFPTADKTSSIKEDSKPKTKDVWTDTKDPSIPVDFKFQGEYVGEIKGGGKLGCQVLALDKGAFQAVVLPGGLPGEGWDGKHKILMDGKLNKHKVTFTPAKGKRKYLAGNPREFSATSTFPPAGQKDYTAVIEGDKLTGKTDDGKEFNLKKTDRKSPTLGAKPPEGAIVLFDGKDTKEWNGGRLDKKTGFLNTDGKDILTKRKFNNYKAHVEFLLPFKPSGREQGRSNSGFYQVDHYEVQVLDSFGLDGKNNECGGIYTKAAPKVNMCLPPLVWQTYDVEFTNAVRNKDGKKIKNARITLKHNGVLIHNDVEVDSPTGGHRGDPEGTPGPIKLQGHDNPLQYRNVWVVERK